MFRSLFHFYWLLSFFSLDRIYQNPVIARIATKAFWTSCQVISKLLWCSLEKSWTVVNWLLCICLCWIKLDFLHFLCSEVQLILMYFDHVNIIIQVFRVLFKFLFSLCLKNETYPCFLQLYLTQPIQIKIDCNNKKVKFIFIYKVVNFFNLIWYVEN